MQTVFYFCITSKTGGVLDEMKDKFQNYGILESINKAMDSTSH